MKQPVLFLFFSIFFSFFVHLLCLPVQKRTGSNRAWCINTWRACWLSKWNENEEKSLFSFWNTQYDVNVEYDVNVYKNIDVAMALRFDSIRNGDAMRLTQTANQNTDNYRCEPFFSSFCLWKAILHRKKSDDFYFTILLIHL